VVPGSSASVTVIGENFVRSSAARCNGKDIPTQYVDNTHLTAQLTPAETIAGTSKISVMTPTPGGGQSGDVTLAVQYPLPQIDGLAPSSVPAGNGDFTLDVKGSSFYEGALVYINNLSRVTTFVSNTELKATILASDIFDIGTTSIYVINPSPSAGYSNSVPLPVTTPTPTITSISPATTFTASQFVLTINGTGMVGGVSVRIDDRTLQQSPTLFPSGTQLQINVSPSDVATPGTHTVQLAYYVENIKSAPFTLELVPSGPGVSYTALGIDIAPFRPARDLSYVGADEWVMGAIGGYYLYRTCWNGLPGCVPDKIVSIGDGFEHGFIADSGRYVGKATIAPMSLYSSTWSDLCINAPPGCVPSSTTSSGDRTLIADMSSDGRYLLLYVRQVDYSEPSPRLYVRDVCAGASNCTPADLFDLPSPVMFGMSSDARYFVYLDSGTVAVLDSCIGATDTCTPKTTLLPSSLFAKGIQSLTRSDNARYILYAETAGDVMILDTCAGVSTGCSPSSVPVVKNAQGDHLVTSSSFDYNYATTSFLLSPDASYVAFYSSDSSLVPNDTNGITDSFVVPTCVGKAGDCVPVVRRVSVTSDGNQLPREVHPVRSSGDGNYLLLSNGNIVDVAGLAF
jgi:hypothetical protein